MTGRAAAVAGALAVGAVALIACGDDPDPPTSAELEASAVGVVAAGCSLVDRVGSGVVVGADGQVVTVAHTIAGASDVTVVAADGSEHRATVVAFDEDSDLAVLAVDTLAAEPLAVGEVDTAAGRLLVWDRDGGTASKPVEVVKQLRITIEDIYVEDVVERTGIEIEGDVEVGDSGGGVVVGGEVIGIVYANSRERGGVGFATDAAELRAVLAARSPDEVPNGRCV